MKASQNPPIIPPSPSDTFTENVLTAMISASDLFPVFNSCSSAISTSWESMTIGTTGKGDESEDPDARKLR